MLTSAEQQKAKDAAGKAAAELVQDDMVVGLGTGSTAACFIQHLSARVAEGLKITAVATSDASLELAKKGKIPITDINRLSSLDFAADGADEIDLQRRMIKGGGGALMREKVIASMSKEWAVMIDPSKRVSQLGKAPLPVEILPFGHLAAQARIEALGLKGKFRQKGSAYYVTDNGNYIFDIHFQKLPHHPEELDQALRSIPGVLDTGFFFSLATKVIIGHPDGRVEILC